MAGFVRRVLPSVVVLVAACALVELYVRVAKVPAWLLPAPTKVLRTLVDDAATLAAASGATAQAALAGFAASAVLGLLMAVVLASSSLVRRAIYPYTVIFQTVPIIAIAPLLILWLDPGFESVAVCAFIVSVFPVITGGLTGLLSTDPALLDLFRLYGARRVPTLWKLRLPFALPSLFGGLRVAAALAVIGTVVAEILVGNLGQGAGLGVTIASAARNGRPDRAFAAVVLTSLMGLALFGAVNLAAHLLLRRWHASEKQ